MTSNPLTTRAERDKIRCLSREDLERCQFESLRRLLGVILPSNRFYQQRFAEFDVTSMVDRATLETLPLTTKSDLLGDGSNSFATNLTFERSQYTRFHRTSGTKGRPLAVLDTPDDWRWWIDAWQSVLDAADLNASDTALMAFSFGPFIGFWSAFDAAIARGLTAIPTGGMTTLARLDLLFTSAATVVFCTPSYALRMAEVAAEKNIQLRDSAVRKIIVAGEPGGSMKSTRRRIETAWDAEVVDHAGASEVGPWGFADQSGTGMFVNEAHFLPELISLDDQSVISVDTLPKLSALSDSSPTVIAELVLTTLGRPGCPVIRYRTGDLVRPVINDMGEEGCGYLFLSGGVLGRTDDMMIIRGVNVFPASVESILREFDEVVEFKVTAFRSGAMDQIKIELESSVDIVAAVQDRLGSRLGLRIDVKRVAAGALPRFEGKARRFIDDRNRR